VQISGKQYASSTDQNNGDLGHMCPIRQIGPMTTQPTIQLRRYAVADRAGLQRLAAWFPKLIPVRERYGFTVLWAYADYDNLQFVWAVSHPGDFEDAVTAYEPSPERSEAFAGFDNPIVEMTIGFVDAVVWAWLRRASRPIRGRGFRTQSGGWPGGLLRSRCQQ